MPDSDLHIFDLNDDCLIKVVSFLDSNDILKLHKVHSRFNGIIVANLHDLEVEITSKNVKQMKGFLRKFGGKVKKMTCWMGTCRQREIEELIETFCNGGNVEHCSLHNEFVMNSDFLMKKLSFFKSLKSLRMIKACVNGDLLYQMLDTMDRIQHLEVDSITSLRTHSFPELMAKLQLLQLKSLRVNRSDLVTYHDWEHSPKVESLKTLAVKLGIYQLPFAMCFPNMDDLTLNALRGYSLNSLKSLTSLKRLRLKINTVQEKELYSLLQHMANRNALQHLTLDLRRVYKGAVTEMDYENDLQVIDILSRLTNLKSLILQTPWRLNSRLLDLVQSLTALRSLAINGDELVSFGVPEIERLVCEMASSAKSLRKIRFELNFKDCITNEEYHQFYENISIARAKQENKALLKVRILDFYRHPSAKTLYIEQNKLVILDVKTRGKCFQ